MALRQRHERARPQENTGENRCERECYVWERENFSTGKFQHGKISAWENFGIAFSQWPEQIDGQHEFWDHHYPGMKSFASYLPGLLLILGLVFGAVRSEAGTPTNSVGFTLTATSSTNLYFLNNTVAITLTVSNGTGFVLDNVYVTNDFSAGVFYVGFTNYYTLGNLANTNGNELDLDFVTMTNGAVAQATYYWQPLAAGRLTNTMVVASDAITNTTSQTNVVEVYAEQADLGVSLAPVSLAYVTNNFWVITNDWVTYQVTVTNSGPGTVTGVRVANNLPSGVSLIPPATTTYGNNVIYTVASLASGASASFQYTLQATNTGSFALGASVGATNLYDPNSSNNQFTNLLFATNYLASLAVATNSVQTNNFQNGLLEQGIQVVNTSGGPVAAVRVVVTGLTNRLFNASGTNLSQPFVVGPAPLAAGAAEGLRLQYLTAGNYPYTFPFTNGQLQAYAVPASVLQYTPKPATQYRTNVNASGIFKLTDGDMLVEFPATPGRSYMIVYSDNLLFSNAMIATPAYVAPANIVQWLDYGPPATLSAPTNSSRRFYRVILNP